MAKKILFVDDDPVSHFIHLRTVKHLGIDCEIRVAYNGRDALQILSPDQQECFVPDYIFVDLDMPVMDGFRFIQYYNALNIPERDNTVMIVLTSSNNGDDRRRAIGLGIENYVVKPIGTPDLLRILESS